MRMFKTEDWLVPFFVLVVFGAIGWGLSDLVRLAWSQISPVETSTVEAVPTMYPYVRSIDAAYEYRDKGNRVATIYVVTMDDEVCYLSSDKSYVHKAIWCKPKE